MLSPPPDGTERVQALARQLGCSVNTFVQSSGDLRAALVGGTAGFCRVLAEFGGRFDHSERVYVFRNWPNLEAALTHVIESRK